MTNFMYKNWRQLEQIGKDYFGEKTKEGISKKYWKLFLYAIAYCMIESQKIDVEAYKCVKEMAKEVNHSKEIRIFFEKVEHSKDDVLYFLNYMKNMEKDVEFYTAYEYYLEEVVPA